MPSFTCCLGLFWHSPSTVEFSNQVHPWIDCVDKKVMKPALLDLHCFGERVSYLRFLQNSVDPDLTGPHSTVSNVPDCRSRAHEFDLDPVPYFHGD